MLMIHIFFVLCEIRDYFQIKTTFRHTVIFVYLSRLRESLTTILNM
jgi:hypothetical protein